MNKYTTIGRPNWLSSFFLCISLIFISIDPAQAKSTATIKTQGDNIIVFIGDTSMENAELFEKTLINTNKPIEVVAITSPGGDVKGGLKIGRLIHEYGLKVYVMSKCASSCANYIATASQDVTVRKGAIFGWHGGATQNLVMSANNLGAIAFTDDDRKWFAKEWSFFEEIQVNQAVTVLGQMPDQIMDRDSSLFSYDIETLRRLGMNIRFEGGKQAQYAKDGTKKVQIFTFSEGELNKQLKLHKLLTRFYIKKLSEQPS